MNRSEYKQSLLDQANAKIEAGWICMGVHLCLPQDQIEAIDREVIREMELYDQRQEELA